MDICSVVVSGRLGRDPELKTLHNGGSVAKYSVACNARRKKNTDTGKYEDETVWFSVETWTRGEKGNQAHVVAKFLRKGARVVIQGSLKEDQWTDQAGSLQRRMVIVTDNVSIIDFAEHAGDPPDQPQEQKPVVKEELPF